MTAASASHKDVNSKGRGAPLSGRRGSANILGVRIRGFFGGLAHFISRVFSAGRSTPEVAEALVVRAYGHLAANTARDRQLAYQFLAMAATIYRDSGRAREADETMTMLRQVQGLPAGQLAGSDSVNSVREEGEPR